MAKLEPVAKNGRQNGFRIGRRNGVFVIYAADP
jgi:hypothetical protein